MARKATNQETTTGIDVVCRNRLNDRFGSQAEVSDGPENVRSWGESGSNSPKSRHSPETTLRVTGSVSTRRYIRLE